MSTLSGPPTNTTPTARLWQLARKGEVCSQVLTEKNYTVKSVSGEVTHQAVRHATKPGTGVRTYLRVHLYGQISKAQMGRKRGRGEGGGGGGGGGGDWARDSMTERSVVRLKPIKVMVVREGPRQVASHFINISCFDRGLSCGANAATV